MDAKNTIYILAFERRLRSYV